jgi:hypothetical protein
MRLTFFSCLAGIAVMLATPAAEARPRSAADDALVDKLLGHADQISTILEEDLDRPRQALVRLDRYLKKHRKAMKGLVGKLVTAAGELDADARSALARDLLWSERTQRVLAALAAFRDKHGEDPAHQKKIEARMAELVAEGKRLFEALMK